MAVTRVWPVPSEKGRRDRQATEYARTYGVETDDPTMEQKAVEAEAAAKGLPQDGSYYVEATGLSHQAAVLTSQAWRRDERNRRLWWCDVTYSTDAAGAGGAPAGLRSELGYPNPNGTGNSGSQGGPPRGGVDTAKWKPGSAKDGVSGQGNYAPGERPADPVFRPPEVSLSTVTVRRVMAWADRYHKPAEGAMERVDINVRPSSSADEEFEQKPEEDLKLTCVTLTRAERNADRRVLASRVGTINLYSFLDDPPFTWLFDDFALKSEYEGIYGFWQVTYRLIYNEEGWPIPILDQGFKARKIAGGTPLEITEAGRNITRPRLLDGAGLELAAGQPPVYRYWWPAGKVSDFAYLHLA